MSLARFDIWVRATMGPAAAGTQVYLCAQPANSNTIPPSPLVALFFDFAGLIPITQPLVCDGFGYAFAYCAPGSYTVITVLGGVIQQVYPDQMVGTGAPGTALALQTNGVQNTIQNVLNIKGTGATTASSDGAGGVTINTPVVTPLALQTNGVANTLQSLLNIKGTGIVTASSDGAGGVTLNAVAPPTATVSWFLGHGFTDVPTPTQTTAVAFASTNTIVGVFMFQLKGSITVTKVSTTFRNAFVGNSNFGIYSLSGNLLLDSGSFNNDAGIGIVQTNLLGLPVVLPAGNYYYAQATTQPSSQVDGEAAIDITMAGVMNVNTVKIGTAANTYNGSALPTTLGTITAINVGNQTGCSMPLFE